MTTNIQEVIKKFENVTENPTIFLQLSDNESNDIKLRVKEIYDFTKLEEKQNGKNKSIPFFVKNLDCEQIWQQLEIQNKQVLNRVTNKTSSLIVRSNELFFKELDKKLTEPEEEQKSESEVFNESPHSDSEDSIHSSETKNESDEETEKLLPGEDKFFNLSEMEAFLKKEESKIEAPNDNHLESTDSEDDDEELFGENLDTSLEDKAKTARFRDFFKTKDENVMSDEEISDKDQEEESMDYPKSSVDITQERLSKKVKRYEDQAVADKPWQLKGEVSAENRPINSLLEDVVGFDLTSRPAPVITEQVSLTLEDIIRQRIKDKLFDSVEKKQKPSELPLEYKKKLVLNQEKSKQSLVQIYEAEYLKQKDAIDGDNDKEDKVESKLHQEVKTLMVNLFSKLDAFSNFHFTSKPAVLEPKIISHIPAINMEEVSPLTATHASSLAPEEIKKKAKNVIVGKNEMSSSDKKRERRNKKRKYSANKSRIEKQMKNKQKPVGLMKKR